MENNKYAIKIWKSLLDILKNENIITPVSFDNWFANTEGVDLKKDKLLVKAEDEFSINWIEENFKADIEQYLHKILGKKILLNLILSKQENDVKKKIELGSEDSLYVWDKYKLLDKNQKKLLSNLNSKFTFSSFISGNSNQLAYNMSISIAERPGNKYNPLFIYGNSGVGKTHLLQAIGNYLIENSEKIPLYVTSEAFLSDYVKSIRNQTTLDFRDKYRKIDVLLIDDIQFFSGKEGIQEEFFHTFNHLYQLNKQIIITSDCKPNELSTLAERLRSRFSWGILTDIKVPELETRIAILQNKIKNLDTMQDINEEVIEYIATNVKTNVRDLEGALNALLANSIINNKETIDLYFASKSLSSYINNFNSEKLTIELIKKQTGKYFNINPKSFDIKSRKEPLATYRHVCIYICKKYTNYSLKHIGFHFGKRDHATIINSIKKVEKLLKTDSNIKIAIEELKNTLNVNK